MFTQLSSGSQCREKLSFSCYFKPSESENTSRKEQPQEKTPFVVAVKTTKSSRKLNQCGELRAGDAHAAVSDQACPRWSLQVTKHKAEPEQRLCPLQPAQLVRAPCGHDLIQLTGDNFHLIPAPNYFVIVTQRSSFQHHDSCPCPVTVVISSPPEYFFRHGLVWFSKES